MNLHQLQRNSKHKKPKRVGRGGKRGTFSGKGTKGQKSRAGAGVKPGFRGGDNRLWQLFPKQRGASKKPGSNRPHAKHRFYQLRHEKSMPINLDVFNRFAEGQEVTPESLVDAGIVSSAQSDIKVLGGGALKKKLVLKGFTFSQSAKDQVIKLGGTIHE